MQSSEPAALATPQFSNAYLIYAVVLMSLVQVVNYMDRYALSIVIEPMRQEFGLSDAQAGLLAGLAFALPFMALALPAAALTDRMSRRKLLACAIALWSLMTGLCSQARNFVTLLIARFGLGIGESPVLPVVHSMITDIVPPHRRAIAMCSLILGAAFGTMMGVGVGGWVSEHLGWRQVFLLAMVPGLVLSIVVFVTLRDAPRGLSDGLKEPVKPASTRETLTALWRRRSYRYVTLGMALVGMAQSGAIPWTPAFLMRSHGMSATEAGAWLSLGSGILSPIGIICGGLLTDYLGGRYKRAMLWVICGAFTIWMIFGLAIFSTTSTPFALVMLCGYSLFSAIGLGPYYAMQQATAGIRFRATASAAGFMIYNFSGTALSPFIIGLISDNLPSPAQSLRISLLIVQMLAVIGIGTMLLAARTMVRDLDDAKQA